MTQPKIPFIFLSPIPKFFKDNGFLKNPKNTAFLLWCFDRCSYETREIFHDNQKLILRPYQFIFGRRICCDESGLTDNEVRHQQELWEKLNFLKKGTNKTPNRFTIYEWSTTCFLTCNHQQNHQQTTNKPPTEPPQTRTREPIELKEQTEQESVSGVCLFSCLVDLVLSDQDIENLMKYPEVDVERAVRSMKENKNVRNPMGFLISALNRGFQPKVNPKIPMSSMAETNKRKAFGIAQDYYEVIKNKDIKIIDKIDHLLFGIDKIYYEITIDEFKTQLCRVMEKYNLISPLKPRSEESKVVNFANAEGISQEILGKLQVKQ